MKQWIQVNVLLMLMTAASPLCATVAPIVSGQSLWWIAKRIGLAIDSIESKVDLIDTSTTTAACGVVELSQSDVSGGTLSITTPGSYCLTEDITAIVSIRSSCVLLDMNGRCVTGRISISSLGSINFVVIKNGFVNAPGASGADISAGITVAGVVSKLFINNVTVECDDSSAGGGIAGRDAIEVAGDDIQIQNCILTAGAGGSSTGTAGVGGDGITLTSTASEVVIAGCIIRGGDGGDETSGGGTAGAGGHGISIVGPTDVVIEQCTVLKAGDGGVAIAPNGGDGGHGIAFITSQSDNVFIKNCTIQKSGAGGNATQFGGDGGHGISVASVSNTKVAVSNCMISDTGVGGNGGTTGGNGGNGVFIGSSNTDISVHNCTISNTGAAGTGGGGAAGKAVDDNVAAGANASKVYANFAHDIGNSIKFDLQASAAESGFALSNPPSSTAVSAYANVFIE